MHHVYIFKKRWIEQSDVRTLMRCYQSDTSERLCYNLSVGVKVHAVCWAGARTPLGLLLLLFWDGLGSTVVCCMKDKSETHRRCWSIKKSMMGKQTVLQRRWYCSSHFSHRNPISLLSLQWWRSLLYSSYFTLFEMTYTCSCGCELWSNLWEKEVNGHFMQQ